MFVLQTQTDLSTVWIKISGIKRHTKEDREAYILCPLLSLNSVVFDVNVELIERNFDAFLVERSLDSLKNIEVYGPIICAVCPNTGNYVYAACTVFCYADKNRDILKYQLMCIAYVGDDFLRLFKVVAVADRESEVNTASVFLGIVYDASGGESAVGDINDLVVYCAQACAGDVDVLNHTRVALSFNEIVHFEGAGENNNNAAGEVSNCTVDSQTDTNAEGRYQGGKSGCVDADVANEADGNNYLHTKLKYVSQNLGDSFVHFTFFGGFFDLSADEVYNLKRNKQNNEGDNYLDTGT